MLTETQISDIKAAVAKITAQESRFKEFNDYYKGKHQLNFASEKFKNKFGERLQKLRQNLCKTVVKAPASRLELINFLADKKNTENPAWEFWKRNKMPLEAGKVHRDAFKTGDAYVIVWEVNRKAKIFVQNPSTCCVWKNAETGETNKAAKLWQENKKYYLNLYYPDRVEKFVSRQDSPENFEPREVPGENFPLFHELGRVPVFNFTFDEESDGETNSILTDVIPLNDALNKSWSDILGAQEENMRRRRYIAGMQVEIDEETNKKINPFKPDDDIFFADDAETKFGEFSDADLAQMIAVLEQTIKAICLVSGIPPSYFNLDSAGTAISGEALRKLEARFTAIVQDAQRSFGATWDEVVACALDVERALDENLIIESQWTDAAPVDESETLKNAQSKIGLGWSYEQVQRDYGLTDAQIEKMKAENQEREKTKVETAARFFDAGASNYGVTNE